MGPRLEFSAPAFWTYFYTLYLLALLVSCCCWLDFADAYLVRNPLNSLNAHHGQSTIHTTRDISVFSVHPSLQRNHDQPPVIVVGKIIVDEYGPPDQDVQPSLTVGGGGPQAALGAALALAAREYQEQKHKLLKSTQQPVKPPSQPVTLMAAVGDLDFGNNGEEEALQELLGEALTDPPLLLRGEDCITPRIRLWHEGENQCLNWYAIDDTFGDERGAGKLWKTTPTTTDYMTLIEKCIAANANNSKPVLHIICEAGVEAPGENGDSLPLLDPQIRQSVSFLGVEPILFPKDDGKVSREDAMHCARIIQHILDGSASATNDDVNSKDSDGVYVVISPDKAAYQAMIDGECIPMTTSSSQFSLDSTAVREGPDGSTIITIETLSKKTSNDEPTTASSSSLHVPAATLRLLNNPTGAGNAYAAAYTALRGSGCDTITSSCIATGIGAVFCEYDHCPPYSYEVLDRIVLASDEVRKRITQSGRHLVK
jgi:hypothetical protein